MSRRFTFKGGIHPPHNKAQTDALSIEVFPAPSKVVIPLQQHIGAPAKPVVKRGDRVSVGQLIGEAGGFVSSTVHSSVSGTVLSVGPFAHPMGKQVIAVEIENDGTEVKHPLIPLDKPWREAAPGELIQKIQSAGIVGMGGASFPTHVKLSPPSNKPIDVLIINGAECEPYLTADHRLLLERTEDFLTGVLILKKILGAKKCIIGIEENKADAIKVISSQLSDNLFKDLTLARLQTKYPQGGEKQLINAVTGRYVPSGGLPMDTGCVVQNVGTAIAARDAILLGIPLYERVVTVTGPTVRSPKNFLVKIGTPIRLLLEACETDFNSTCKVIMGGPMMGIAQSDLDTPVIKSTSGLLAYDKIVPGLREHPCISCGRCIKVCPIHLVPSRLAKFVEKEIIDEAEVWNIMDCVECGSCTYVCPSKINLVHFMKLGKFSVQAKHMAAVNK
ncbi:MAG TPA: electron transport complex subunit RsxC [Chitinispirillaceae bacterium]|nr:electron transport complex subunit RsxC [Chitinispirillaceae bacterium]